MKTEDIVMEIEKIKKTNQNDLNILNELSQYVIIGDGMGYTVDLIFKNQPIDKAKDMFKILIGVIRNIE